MKERSIIVPADVPAAQYERFVRNMLLLTRGTSNIFLFTGDHGIEHLHQDMVGPHMPPEVQSPQHLFSIAAAGYCGGFVGHAGLIARYGKQYPHIPYVVKLNAKTNSIDPHLRDPLSRQLVALQDITTFMDESGLLLSGIGYTIYLGSLYETEMLREAAQALITAHQHGLVGILWIYPRGAGVSDPYDLELVAGAASVAVCLGADFVKLQLPLIHTLPESQAYYQRIVAAAGSTGVICAGGHQIDTGTLFHTIERQLAYGTAGVAIGRNIYQNTKEDAVMIASHISALVYGE